jgi:hypothetical protein
MKLSNLVATAWGLIAVLAACWLIRPVPAERQSPKSGPAVAPGESELSRGAADTATNQGVPRPVAEAPPVPAAPESPLSESPNHPAAGLPGADAFAPGPQLGGLPVDGDELRAMGWADVEALAQILQNAGTPPESLRLHLRAVYGHVQRLRLYRAFLEQTEARFAESREAGTTPIDEVAPAGEANPRTAFERLARADRDRVNEYEAYVRRSLTRDLAITNQVVLERIFELAGPPAEPGAGMVPEPEMGNSPR